MIYVDTSALVPLYVPETGSLRLRRFLGKLPTGSAAISEWTLTEFASAIGARVRAHALDAGLGREALREMAELAAASFNILPPLVEDYRAARVLMARFESGLRAGDALHLAIAARIGAEILTLDRVLRQAAPWARVPVRAF